MFCWETLGNGIHMYTTHPNKYTQSWHWHSLMAVAPPAGRCARSHCKNCSGMVWKVTKRSRCWTGLHIPQIAMWSSIQETYWNKSDPKRPHWKSDLTHLTHWPSGMTVWCLALGQCWPILWVLWFARWGLQLSMDAWSDMDLGNLKNRSMPWVLCHIHRDGPGQFLLYGRVYCPVGGACHLIVPFHAGVYLVFSGVSRAQMPGTKVSQ